MQRRNNFEYKLLQNKNKVLFYIPHKKNNQVKKTKLIENDFKLLYEGNKTYTIYDIEKNNKEILENEKEIWIVEYNKEKILIKAYKVDNI